MSGKKAWTTACMDATKKILANVDENAKCSTYVIFTSIKCCDSIIFTGNISFLFLLRKEFRYLPLNTNNMYFLLSFIFITSLISYNSFKFSPHRITNRFKQQYIHDRFEPVCDEKTIHIPHNDSKFSRISGNFFAQIGSNPRHFKNEHYHWFDGDGMVHGIFFNQSKMIYQNKWIRTKRMEVENRWKKKMYLYFGELKGINGIIQILKFCMMEWLGFLPKAKGTANTAIINWHDRFFALHEGDMPYEINIDKSRHNISTLGRLNYTSIHSMTAHPVIDEKRHQIYFYGYNNYDFSYGQFIFNIFDTQLTLMNQFNISLLNNGMIHDVAFTGDEVIIPDMPLKYDPSLILNEKLPLYFDKKKGITRFGIINVDDETCSPIWYYFKENFFIFHFAGARLIDDTYIIHACVMDHLYMEDFVNLHDTKISSGIIRGNLRLKEIRIKKGTNETQIFTNTFIDHLHLSFPYNLDFPKRSVKNPSQIYCSIFDASTGCIRGYMKLDTLRFTSAIPDIYLLNDQVYGNSEPQPILIDDNEYLLTYTSDQNDSFISLIDVVQKSIHSQKIPTRIPPGFHSTFF